MNTLFLPHNTDEALKLTATTASDSLSFAFQPSPLSYSEWVGKWQILPFNNVPLFTWKEKKKYNCNLERFAKQEPKTQ